MAADVAMSGGRVEPLELEARLSRASLSLQEGTTLQTPGFQPWPWEHEGLDLCCLKAQGSGLQQLQGADTMKQ